MPEYKMPSFDEVLFQAVVDQFFEPQLVGMQMSNMGVPGPNGSLHYPMQPTYAEAPLAQAVRTMYDQHRNEIAKRLFEKIDLDDFIERLASLVIARLTEAPNTYGTRFNAEIEDVRKRVHDKVADEMTRRHLAKLDALDAPVSAAEDTP